MTWRSQRVLGGGDGRLGVGDLLLTRDPDALGVGPRGSEIGLGDRDLRGVTQQGRRAGR